MAERQTTSSPGSQERVTGRGTRRLRESSSASFDLRLARTSRARTVPGSNGRGLPKWVGTRERARRPTGLVTLKGYPAECGGQGATRSENNRYDDASWDNCYARSSAVFYSRLRYAPGPDCAAPLARSWSVFFALFCTTRRRVLTLFPRFSYVPSDGALKRASRGRTYSYCKLDEPAVAFRPVVCFQRLNEPVVLKGVFLGEAPSVVACAHQLFAFRVSFLVIADAETLT